MIAIPNALSTDIHLTNKQKAVVVWMYRVCGNARLEKIIKISDIQKKFAITKVTAISIIDKIVNKTKYVAERKQLDHAGNPYAYKMFYYKQDDKVKDHILISEEYLDILFDNPNLLIDYIKIKQANWYFSKVKATFQESIERFGMTLDEFNSASLRLSKLGIVSEYYFPPPVFVESNGTKLFVDDNQPVIKNETKPINNKEQVTEQPKQLDEYELSALRREVEECTDSINYHTNLMNTHDRNMKSTFLLSKKNDPDLSEDERIKMLRENEHFNKRYVEYSQCKQLIEIKKQKLNEARQKLFDYGY